MCDFYEDVGMKGSDVLFRVLGRWTYVYTMRDMGRLGKTWDSMGSRETWLGRPGKAACSTPKLLSTAKRRQKLSLRQIDMSQRS